MPRRYIALPAVPIDQTAGEVRIRCPLCGETSSSADWRAHGMVCPWCSFHFPLTAGQYLDLLADEGSFHPLKGAPAGPALFGQAHLLGRPLAMAAGDLATQWSSVEVQALVALAEEARLEQWPLLWVLTAPQGAAAEALVLGVQAALGQLREAGRPWIALLSGPCYGALVALALQADLVLAEPGTAIDLAAPEVLRQAGRLPLESARPARSLLRAGWADAVLTRPEQRSVLAHLLDLLGGERPRGRSPRKEVQEDLLRPGEALAGLCDLFVELHGDRGHEDDRALIGGLARLRQEGASALVLATAGERGWPRFGGPGGAIGAGGWRKATRLLGLAGRFGLPVVILVDRVDLRAGRRDRPAEIAAAMGATLSGLLSVPVPSITVYRSRPESQAGLALAASDCLLAATAAAAGLQEQGLSPDGVFAGEEDLQASLAQHLQELTQTYASHGPLGRRKLLQRRHARWTRLSLEGESRASPEQGAEKS